jgi:predicted anti-sigma-YlaC factor YlaD
MRRLGLLMAAGWLIAFASCSIQSMAMKETADALSAPSGVNTFTSDNDPELVGEALPFALKFYESLLASQPEHEGLRLRTGSLYVMYARAFVQTPGDLTPRSQAEAKKAFLNRAKNLYLRGRDILLQGLEKRNPRLQQYWRQRRYKEAAAPFRRQDVPALFWTAAGWIAAYAVDPFDIKLGLTLPQAASLMERVLELDPGFGDGAVHNFYVLYYGSLPDYMGGDLGKAREHFRLALEAAGNRDTSPYLALATTVVVKEQKVEEFRDLLGRVLAFDPDSAPENRLVNVINRRKARWLLDHLDDFFILVEKEGATAAERRSG